MARSCPTSGERRLCKTRQGRAAPRGDFTHHEYPRHGNPSRPFIRCGSWLSSCPWNVNTFTVNQVRITVHSSHEANNYEEIDAVRLITGGSPTSTTTSTTIPWGLAPGDYVQATDNSDGQPVEEKYYDGGALVQTREYTYDESNDLASTAVVDTLDHDVTHTYNSSGQETSVTNRNGYKQTFEYDDGKVTQEKWYDTDGTTFISERDYTYSEDGSLHTATNSIGTYTFTYNEAGQLTGVVDPFGVTLTFGYDANGNRNVVTDSFGGETDSTYSDAGQLTSTVYSATGDPSMRIDQTYTHSGQIETQHRYSSTTTSSTVGTSDYVYDDLGRLTSLTHKKADNTTVAGYTWGYNSANQLTSQSDHGHSYTYSYDDAGELTGDGTNSWSYDGAGNRTTATIATDGSNEMLDDGTWAYTYDNEGNETSKVNDSTTETWQYGYDNINELTTVKHKATSSTAANYEVDYQYDVFGNRAVKQIIDNPDGMSPAVASTLLYAYDIWNPAKTNPIGNENSDVLFDMNGSYDLLTRYIRGDVVDQVFGRIDYGTSNVAYWNLTDHLGSIRDISNNSNGNVVDTITYGAFGNITSETHDEFGGRYKWTGRETDVETGLQYNRARYYDSSTGRWISQDPMGFDAGDSNVYRYVKNKPTEHSDPSGLYETDIHFYMTYYLAAAAGLGGEAASGLPNRIKDTTQNAAYAVAWFAQHVDDDVTSSPVEPANIPVGGPAQFWHFYSIAYNANGLDTAGTKPKLITQLAAFVRQFKAGTLANIPLPVTKNSAEVQEFVTNSQKGGIQALGMALHTYEDSWSHEGFQMPVGHAGTLYDGHAPDYPWLDPKRAMDMAENTYNVLADYAKANGIAPIYSWKDISGNVQSLVKRSTKSDMSDSNQIKFRKGNPLMSASDTNYRILQWQNAIKEDFDLDAAPVYSFAKTNDPWQAAFNQGVSFLKPQKGAIPITTNYDDFKAWYSKAYKAYLDRIPIVGVNTNLRRLVANIFDNL